MNEDRNAARRKAYNKRNYTRHTVYVRNDSELAEAIEDHMNKGGKSINFLLTELLCQHFKVKIPHKFTFEKNILETYYIEPKKPR